MNRDFTLPFQKWGREVIVEMNKDRHKRVEANWEDKEEGKEWGERENVCVCGWVGHYV